MVPQVLLPWVVAPLVAPSLVPPHWGLLEPQAVAWVVVWLAALAEVVVVGSGGLQRYHHGLFPISDGPPGCEMHVVPDPCFGMLHEHLDGQGRAVVVQPLLLPNLVLVSIFHNWNLIEQKTCALHAHWDYDLLNV